METSASFEARSAPSPYPTEGCSMAPRESDLDNPDGITEACGLVRPPFWNPRHRPVQKPLPARTRHPCDLASPCP